MPFQSISIEASESLIREKSVVIIDVRELSEYIDSHIVPHEGKVHLIPLGEISLAKVQQVNPEEKPILIYCRSGRRSKCASNTLLEQHYQGVIYEMDEGILGWAGANLPTRAG